MIENKIDYSRILGIGDFKGLTGFRHARKVLFFSSLREAKGDSAPMSARDDEYFCPFRLLAVADPGEGPRGPARPYF